MRKSVKKKYWKLFYMGIALGYLLVIVLGGYGVRVLKARNAYYLEADKALLAHLAPDANMIEAGEDGRVRKGTAQKEEPVSIVMLGNSRLRLGFSCGLQLENEPSLCTEDNLRFVQYSLNAANFAFYKPLWPAILSADPDVLVIQDQVLTGVMLKKNYFMLASLLTKEAVKNLYRRPDFHEQWKARRYDKNVTCRDSFRPWTVQGELKFMARRERHSLKDNKNLVAAHYLVSEAVAQGIKVLILHMPPLVEAITTFGVPLHSYNTYGLSARPTPEDLFPKIHNQLSWVDYPKNLPPEMYCDISHYNEAGRAAFTSWFLGYLKALTGKQGG